MTRPGVYVFSMCPNCQRPFALCERLLDCPESVERYLFHHTLRTLPQQEYAGAVEGIAPGARYPLLHLACQGVFPLPDTGGIPYLYRDRSPEPRNIGSTTGAHA